MPLLLTLSGVFLLASCEKDDDECETVKVSVFAGGFNNPRGLKFGPDGWLYVAEAGLGGTEETNQSCEGATPPGVLGSPTGGRISKVSSNGMRTTVTESLPTSLDPFGSTNGVSDIAFYGNTLYALIDGAGCSGGVSSFPKSIVKINSSDSSTIVADLGSWAIANPVANPPQDFDPEGVWYSMVNVGNVFYTLDANHGQLVKVTTDGTIERLVDLSKEYGHTVPTAIAYHGDFYVGNLGTFPIVDGSQSIYKVTPGGTVSIARLGVTAVLGVAFDNENRLYVLETTAGNPFPTPGAGRIIRVNADGSQEVIATGLSNPTAMTYGPDGNLYVSNWGFGKSEDGGEILKVTLPKTKTVHLPL